MRSESKRFSAKVPIRLSCGQCSEPFKLNIHLNETSFDWTCPKCGFHHYAFFSLNVTIGCLLLEKSRHELLDEKNYPMAIVFAAMAFESELSRMFGRWKEIACILPGKIFDREECERELRAFNTITRKIEGVAQFLVGTGIDAFVESQSELSAQISANFKSVRVGHLAADFQKHLFWPRNKILHWGDVSFSPEDAAKCFSIAELGLQILRKMDDYRGASLP